MARVAVLLSGGVDSSVALRLLLDQGHQLTAFYLKIWLEDELSYLGDCPWEQDLTYARAVCEQAGVPLEIVNFQEEYWARVVAYALAEIKAGRTPNPDIMCNKEIKFGAFLDRYGHDFDAVATGHYSQKVTIDGVDYLRMAPDPVKDQTYFLARLSQEQLKKAMFPIGHLTKAQVRQLAQRYGLATKDRKDSQGICFLGTIKFDQFLRHHFGDNPGELVEEETGVKLGTHNGFYYFTIGQRQGIGLSGGPWYVVRKDPASNTVFISKSYFGEDKERRVFEVTDCVFDPFVVSDFAQQNSIEPHGSIRVKLRHGPALQPCTISGTTVTLEQNDQGIAAGQFAVFYKDDICVGSAKIKGVL